MSLILLDFLQNKSQAQDLKDDVIASFFAGIVAVQLSEGKDPQAMEEAMICAMFLNLGRMIVKFYFFEESEEIARLIEDKKMDEEQASLSVLGVSYNELGVGIAKTWNFPVRLISGMKKLKGTKIVKPSGETGDMSVTVNLANELCAIATVSDPKDKKDTLKKIRARYSGVTEVSDEKLSTSLEKGLEDLSIRSQVLGLDTSKSTPLKNLRAWLAHTGDGKKTVPAGNQDAATLIDQSIDAETLVNTDVQPKADPEVMLSDGIQDVTNTLVGEFKLNDVLQMVLETIYRSLGFDHVLIFSRDVKQGKMIARFGFGEGVADILPHFRFPLAFEADVFHLSLEKALDIIIEDVAAPNIASKIPQWHTKAINSRYFLLLPIVMNKVAVGLIYADKCEAKQLHISPRQLALLRTLRNQAVLAIKQKA